MIPTLSPLQIILLVCLAILLFGDISKILTKVKGFFNNESSDPGDKSDQKTNK